MIGNEVNAPLCASIALSYEQRSPLPATDTSKWKMFSSRGGWTLRYPTDWEVSSCNQCDDLTAPNIFVVFGPMKASWPRSIPHGRGVFLAPQEYSSRLSSLPRSRGILLTDEESSSLPEEYSSRMRSLPRSPRSTP